MVKETPRVRELYRNPKKKRIEEGRTDALADWLLLRPGLLDWDYCYGGHSTAFTRLGLTSEMLSKGDILPEAGPHVSKTRHYGGALLIPPSGHPQLERQDSVRNSLVRFRRTLRFGAMVEKMGQIWPASSITSVKRKSLWGQNWTSSMPSLEMTTIQSLQEVARCNEKETWVLDSDLSWNSQFATSLFSPVEM